MIGASGFMQAPKSAIDDVFEKPRGQMPADGFCGMCPNPVPEVSLNKFYCSRGCASLAFAHYQEIENGGEV